MKEQQPDAGKTARSSVDVGAHSRSEAADTSSSVPEKPPEEARPALKIPPILLEKDDPSTALAPAADPKFALGPGARQERFEAETGELPPAYGSGRLLVIPRDPHWLYTHWDLASEQQRAYNALSMDRHMVLRVHVSHGGAPFSEIHVHPESLSWFVEVPEAGAEYEVELGYYQGPSEWVTVASSLPIKTPPEGPAKAKTAHFGVAGVPATALTSEAEGRRPIEEPVPTLTATDVIIPPRVEWIPALDKVEAGLEEAAAEGETGFEKTAQWSPAQEKAMAELVSLQGRSGRAGSSLEIAEWVRWEIEREISSQQFGRPLFHDVASSPAGGESLRLKGFWFNVNAELIIYGSTDPKATVTVGGEPIEVRADGTFTCRLALPDGEYDVHVAAHSETDSRRAKLSFRRATEYQETGG